MDKETVVNIIEKTSELYREKMREAKELSNDYDDVLEEINNEDIIYKKYLKLESRLEILSEKTNNSYHIAEGISNVREMLFELLNEIK